MFISLFAAIDSLGYGNQVGSIVGDSYEGIQWINEPMLTKEEVETEYERLKLIQKSYEYKELRAQEYPDFKDYLDGIVKGDQEQVQEYIQKCLAVKEKYPKPF